MRLGYVLHRKLEALEVTNYVICPINWDERHKGVKTDGRDATQIALALDGYLRGNDRSFSVVRVPSKEEEQLRSITRQRQSLIKERSRNTNRGRSYALYYGVALKGIWWAPRNWKELEDTLSDHLVQLLKPLRALILVINEQIRQVVEAQLNQMESVALPKGMGTVLFQQTEREVGDWGVSIAANKSVVIPVCVPVKAPAPIGVCRAPSPNTATPAFAAHAH